VVLGSSWGTLLTPNLGELSWLYPAAVAVDSGDPKRVAAAPPALLDPTVHEPDEISIETPSR